MKQATLLLTADIQNNKKNRNHTTSENSCQIPKHLSKWKKKLQNTKALANIRHLLAACIVGGSKTHQISKAIGWLAYWPTTSLLYDSHWDHNANKGIMLVTSVAVARACWRAFEPYMDNNSGFVSTANNK